MGRIVWKLKGFMLRHDIKPLDIEREAIRLGYDIGKNVIYRVATDEGPQRIDRDTLAAVIGSLRSLSGRGVRVGDIVEYQEDGQ